jgi:serine/threonine protein phosphatase PrpC
VWIVSKPPPTPFQDTTTKMATFKITSSGATDIGGYYENQDAFFTDGAGFFGVCDGHGQHGRISAQIARDTLQAAGAAAEAVTTFEAADRAVIGAIVAAGGPRATIDPDGTIARHGLYGTREVVQGGTTATRCSVRGGVLEVAHAGDSEVLVIHESGEFKLLTVDHGPTSLPEYLRLRAEATALPSITFHAAGGRFGNPHAPPRHVFTTVGDGNVQLNPVGGYYTSNVRGEWAAYVARGDTQLNMMRTLGDCELKAAGVTARPDVLLHQLLPHGRTWIVAASDGLYDAMHYHEVRDVVLAAAAADPQPAAVARALLAASLKKSRSLFGPRIDNTTMVVALAEPGPVQLRVPLDFAGYAARTLSSAEMLRLLVSTRGRGLGLCYRPGHDAVVQGTQPQSLAAA